MNDATPGTRSSAAPSRAQLPVVDCLVLGDEGPILVANECTRCGARFVDRQTACASCSGETFIRRTLAHRGVVRAFTITYRAPPGVVTPFVSTIVDLDGGGTVKANLVDVDPRPDAVEVGIRVELCTFVAGVDVDGTEAIAFAFHPAEVDARA